MVFMGFKWVIHVSGLAQRLTYSNFSMNLPTGILKTIEIEASFFEKLPSSVFFERGLGLVVNVYCKIWGNKF